ncbi:MAG TPA: GNAT family N-acetyltransferase [Steroidobacteraceae bacterium]|nr:GNAT family N-acetyltransferase [Steroidobacteraceae bacterium]
MFISIRDARNSRDDRRWIENAYHEYVDDLTRISMNTGMFPAFADPNLEFGDRQADMMARWFSDDSSYPLVILSDNAPNGFALVSRPTMKRANIDFRMAEFFVLRNARRHGVGREAAALIFNRFDGRWEVVEFIRNTAAVAFWRNIIGGYTNGHFHESIVQGEVHHTFRSEPTHAKLKAV